MRTPAYHDSEGAGLYDELVLQAPQGEIVGVKHKGYDLCLTRLQVDALEASQHLGVCRYAAHLVVQVELRNLIAAAGARVLDLASNLTPSSCF